MRLIDLPIGTKIIVRKEFTSTRDIAFPFIIENKDFEKGVLIRNHWTGRQHWINREIDFREANPEDVKEYFS